MRENIYPSCLRPGVWIRSPLSPFSKELMESWKSWTAAYTKIMRSGPRTHSNTRSGRLACSCCRFVTRVANLDGGPGLLRRRHCYLDHGQSRVVSAKVVGPRCDCRLSSRSSCSSHPCRLQSPLERPDCRANNHDIKSSATD